MAKKKPKAAQRARIACEKWRANFKQNIDLYHLMHQFVLGDQWTKEEQNDMVKTYRKTPLTSNKLGAMANSLLGEQQQNTPQIQVIPLSDCDEEVASIREALTKDILLSADSMRSYQVAASQAAIGGFGAFGVGTEYLHDKSFDVDIVTFHFKDATRCYWDISAESINKIDGAYCGYISRISREAFRKTYGKDIEQSIGRGQAIAANQEEVALATEPSGTEDPFNWADADGITILNHYARTYITETIYELSNGRVLDQKEMDELIDSSIDINQAQMMENQLQDLNQEDTTLLQDEANPEPPQEILPLPEGMMPPLASTPMQPAMSEESFVLWDEGQPVRIERQKKVRKDQIIHYQYAGDYELDKTVFPAQTLPIIYMDNNSFYNKDGTQICRSFFSDCRDTQRYINYLRTQSAYILKCSRYDQWIGSKKNVASLDTQNNWRNPSNTQGMITYDESPSGAKPEQIRPPELSASLTQQYQLAIEDLYTSTGLYPARMGNNGDEASGKAIDARTRQGSYTTFVFNNSVNRAVEASGIVINQMIPNVYDTKRVVSLMMPDSGMTSVTLNEPMDKYGEKIKNDIRKGTYKVVLKPGPSYEGQKEQALLSLREVLQANPAAFNLIADLYAESLPLGNTLEIKNRLKTLVPPEIIEAGQTGKMPQNQQPNPEQQALMLQQQNQQQKMQIEQMELSLKAQELEVEKQKIMMEAQFKIQELETERLEAAGKLKEQELRYMAETERTASEQAIANAENLVKILTHKIQ